MKDGVKIISKDGKIYIEGGNFKVREYRDNDWGYSNPYLSWENFSYTNAEKQQEETDDYLLNQALQNDKKLCVSFYTKDVSRILKVFDDTEKYDVFVKKAVSLKHKGFSYVFVTKKGYLSDYFDFEKLEDIYENAGFRTGWLASFMEVPLINFFNGEHKEDGVVFDTYLDTENTMDDEVLQLFGPSALIVIGLLYGYPIESTVRILTRLFPYG